MIEDGSETQDQADSLDSGEDYAAPALTDLGSFQELTQISAGSGIDNEGAS